MMISRICMVVLGAYALAGGAPGQAAEVNHLRLHSTGHITSQTCQTSGFSFEVKVTGTADDSSGQDAVTFQLVDGKGNTISNSFIMLPIGKTFESNILLAVSLKTFGEVSSPQSRPFKVEAIESGVPFSTEGAVLAAATFDPSAAPANVSSCAYLPEEKTD